MKVRTLLALICIALFCCDPILAAGYEIDVLRDFIPQQYQEQIRTGTCTVDLSGYIQSAINSLGESGGILTFPTGRYQIDHTLVLPGTQTDHPTASWPIQIIGSSSFLGGVKDWGAGQSWNGTTFYTTSSEDGFAFIDMNLTVDTRGRDHVIILSDATHAGSMIGWRIRGIRFDAPDTSTRRIAIRGAYVANGVIEDCGFRGFDPTGTADTLAAVIDLGYKGSDNLASHPYNENLLFSRLKFTDNKGFCINAGQSNDNLEVRDCYVMLNARNPDFFPKGLLRTSGACVVSLNGGIYAVPYDPHSWKRFVIVEAWKATAVNVSSIHCEGPAIIVRTGDCNNVSVSNSYFQVHSPEFSLVSVYYSTDAQAWAHNSVSACNNTFHVVEGAASVPGNLYLTGLGLKDFPLGIFSGNVAYRLAADGSGRAEYLDMPALRVGKGDLEVSASGNVRARHMEASGSIRCGSDATEAASSSNAGSIRYRADARGSSVEVSMQVAPDRWAWVPIATKSF